jgi:hypothetical protein
MSKGASAVQSLPLEEVQVGPNDRVFRHARMRALIVWLVGFALAAALFFGAFTNAKWRAGYIFGPFLLLFLLLTLKFVTARFHPSNGLVRMNDSGIYVQFRSYLNYRLPSDDPSVVFLAFGEIVSARLVKERVEKPDPVKPGASETTYMRYVELELCGETAPLVSALAAERAESAPMQKRWYGSSSTLYRDYPVAINTPPFMRIRWDVVPGSKAFLSALRPYTVIATTVSLTQDFTRLQSLSPEEQMKQLRELAQRGDVITATYLSRKLYGGSLAEARAMVDGMQRGAQL